MLKELENLINKNKNLIDEWYENKVSKVGKCFYTSVDLRFSGEKLVPVDTNLFPAGFNNLNSASIASASILAKEYLSKLNYNKGSKILLIGESHDRNLHYQNNLNVIGKILSNAGYDAVITNFENPSIKQRNNLIQLDGFIPELVVLNNDLSSGVPEVLKNIKQPIIPDINYGWYKRRKSTHFSIYNQLMKELEELIKLPGYFFTTEFDICDEINFKSQIGIEKLKHKVDAVLSVIKEKYKIYGIKQEPYVVVKSDYGTYGMGIMIIRDAEEISNMNKKLRNKMHITKSNILNEQVIIQEGVKTIDKINNHSAEPLLYLINNEVVEFMYRNNNSKDEFANLNSSGMNIESNSKSSNYDDYLICCNFVAKISALAASLELNIYKD